jgi:hypothetical protein
MSVELSEERLYEEGGEFDAPVAWTDEDMQEADVARIPAKERRGKYVARRDIERYWEWKALRSHLDDFVPIDAEF